MRKIRKSTSHAYRVFAVALASALLFTMPGMVSYAEAQDVQAENISESVTELTDVNGIASSLEEPGTGESGTDKEEGEEMGESGENTDEGQDEDSSGEEGEKPENPEENPEEGEEMGESDENTDESQEKEPEEEGEETENSGENPEEEETENPEENLKEDEEETDGEDSALLESGSPEKLAARSGAQSEQTEDSVASVTIGGETEYYDNFIKAWDAAQGQTATIWILKDVDLDTRELQIDDAASDITLEMSDGVTLSGKGGRSGRSFMYVSAGSLTMKSGTLLNTLNAQGHGVDVKGGSFILEGGTVQAEGTDKWNTAVHATNDSTVLIKGGEIIANKYGLYAGNSSVTIEGGEITSSDGNAIMLSNCKAAEIKDGKFEGRSGIYLEAGTAKISGGTFYGRIYQSAYTGDNTACFRLTGGKFISEYTQSIRGNNTKLIDWLEEGYCYYDIESGNIVQPVFPHTYYLETSVMVAECNHSLWKDWTIDEEDNHSHVCEGCGKTESGPHQWDGDGSCTVCGQQAVARVMAAGETKYYSLMSNAWKAAQGKTATVTIIQDVKLEENTLEMNDKDSNITLEMAEGVVLERPINAGCLIHIIDGNFTFASGTAKFNYPGYNDMQDASVILVDGGNVRLEGGMLTNTSRPLSWYGCGIKVNGGRLVVSGGEVKFSNARNVGVQVNGGEAVMQGGSITASYKGIEVTGGKLTVEGGTLIGETSGYGLYDSNGISVLYGGTFTGGTGAIFGYTSSNMEQMLGEGCVYYYLDDDGNKILVTSISGTLKGTVIVDICDHDYGDWEPDGNGSHIRNCTGCGIEEKEDCDYKYSPVSDTEASGKEGHIGICTACGYQKTQEAEAHTVTPWKSSDTQNGYVRSCTVCEWQQTAEITQSPKALQIAYGQTGEQELSVAVAGAEASYAWKLQGEDGILSTEESYSLSDNLSVGNYNYDCIITLEDDSEPTVTLPYSLQVTPASLGEATVTAEEGGGIFYDGKEKEPAITVTLNGKTLVKDIDYKISYTNNVNAGTGTVTVTGIGNYMGNASADFTIHYYETEAVATGPKDWCNRAQISAPDGFSISDSLDGEFGDALYYGTETGMDGTEVTYYLKQDETGYITEAKIIKVKVDTTQPSVDGTGNGIKITDRDAWWQKLLSKITFGHYKTQVVIVQAADSLAGIDKIYYYVDQPQKDTPLTAEELREVSADKWESSDSVTFTLDKEGSHVIYAYAVDKVGNQSAYICSDGIVIDNTPPTVTLAKPSQDEKIKDTSAALLAQMNETGNITYVLLHEADSNITAEEIFHSTDKGTGSVTAGQVGENMELHFTALKANTTYYLYAVGTDAAGNISDMVSSLTFTTLKTAIAGTVLLDGKEAYGEKLTASVNIGLEDHGKISYQWYRIDENGNDIEITGTTSESYTLTAEDIGCGIRVKVTAQNCSGSLIAETGDKIQKADPSEETMPVNGRVNDTLGTDTFTFTGKSGVVYEYSTDGGSTWKTMEDDAFSSDASDHTKVTGTIEIGNYAHVAGQVQVRSKETETLKAGKELKNAAAFTASLEGSVILTGTEKYGETLTAAADGVQSGVTLIYSFYRDDTGEAIQTGESNTYTLTAADIGKNISVKVTAEGYTGALTAQTKGVVQKAEGVEIPGTVDGSYIDDGQTYTYTVNAVAGAEYRIDGGPWQTSNVFTNISPGSSHIFEARMAETDCYEAGGVKGTGQVAFPKITPAAPVLQYQVEKSESGMITVTIAQVDGAEYSFDGGKTWGDTRKQDGFETSQTVTLAIRLKETATHTPSLAQTVTVNLAKENREAPPQFTLQYEANGETDYTVTIPPTEGCEYSFDGETWSESNIKNGVKVGETVTGYKRYKETDDYNASSVVKGSETMPRFTVKTPVISPAGGSYSGSINVDISCKSLGAEIYYTTDGSTPGRNSTRYTGNFTVTAPATVKAIAIKEGLTDSAVVTASYTKQSSSSGDNSGSSGSSGSGDSGGSSDSSGSDNSNGFGEGNSGDNGNVSGGSGSGSESDKDGGQGSSIGDSENGNITIGMSVIPSTERNKNTNSETKIETVKPGTGNTVRPETGTGGGNSTSQKDIVPTDTALKGREPFIKDEDGKIGWDVIRIEEEKAKEGSSINIDMNGTTVVPGDIFGRLKGRDIIITFDMGNGIIWSVDGKSIPRDVSLDISQDVSMDASQDIASDIDFSVKMGVNTIPVDIVNNWLKNNGLKNNVTGESYNIQISLAYEGEFGFTAVLSINLGKENAGYKASLYYYNESAQELEFICSDTVAEDGTALFTFTHASEYVIVLEGEEESGDVMEAAQLEGEADAEVPDGNDGTVEESQGNGKNRNYVWLIVIGIIAIATLGGVVVLARKRKDEEKEEKKEGK